MDFIKLRMQFIITHFIYVIIYVLIIYGTKKALGLVYTEHKFIDNTHN